MAEPASGSATGPLVAGLDLGGTKVLGLVLDPADPARALVTERVDTPRGGQPAEIRIYKTEERSPRPR